jgi:hypothetical protein
MSEESVEALRQIIEAFQDRDWDRIRETPGQRAYLPGSS